MRRWLLALAAALLLLGVAACTGSPAQSPADAGAPTGPRCLDKASPGPSAAVSPGPGPALPAMALPCFSGGRYTDVADLAGRPTIVNLWASYCEPCRVELPALEQFATATAGSVRVVGVVTKDTHSAAQSVIDAKRLTFPMLEDPGQQLAIAVSPLVDKALVSLPATLFVTPGGRIAYAYQGPALTDARIRELTKQYLGVAV